MGVADIEHVVTSNVHTSEQWSRPVVRSYPVSKFAPPSGNDVAQSEKHLSGPLI